MRPEDLAKTLDHTVLAPGTDAEEVARACAEARRHHFAALCGPPEHVPLMAAALRGSDVKVCTVVDFPGGDSGTEARIRAAQRAVDEGAHELDLVMDHRALAAGDVRRASDDLVAVVAAVRARAANAGRGEVLVKVIIEAPLLGDKRSRLACRIVERAGADFAKTCTGRGTVATVEDVELMRDALPEGIGVKAAGGIRTLADVERMVGAGACRVGTSAAVAVAGELAALAA